MVEFRLEEKMVGRSRNCAGKSLTFRLEGKMVGRSSASRKRWQGGVGIVPESR